MTPHLRHRIILGVILAGLILGIAQGLPDAIDTLALMLGFN